MTWQRVCGGWYWLRNDSGDVVAAITLDAVGRGRRWCVHIDVDMPHGDSQHDTLREAKAEAERRTRCVG
jgi:hypothetical protein